MLVITFIAIAYVATASVRSDKPASEAVKCFSVLSHLKCSKIQEAGERIQDGLEDLHGLLMETVSTSMADASQILNASMAILKGAIRPMNAANPPRLDGAKLVTTEQKIMDAMATSIRDANHGMHQVVKAMMAQLTDGSDAVTAIMFPSHSAVSLSSSHSSTLGDSLEGISTKASGSIEARLVKMSADIFASFQPMIKLFADILKAILQGNPSVDVDSSLRKMNTQLKQQAASQDLYSLPRFSELLQDIVEEMDGLNDITGRLHEDKTKVADALGPAASLVHDAIASCDAVETNKAFIGGAKKIVAMAIEYYQEIRATVMATDAST